MILTNKQRNFIINNKVALTEIYKARIEDVKNQIINEENPDKRNALVLLAREYYIMVKDIEDMTEVSQGGKEENLI